MKTLRLGMLLLLASFASVGAVIFAPALTSIALAYNISTGHAESLMSIFLIGYAAGQLLYGPAANHFGRIKSLKIGISLALVGSLLGIIATAVTSFNLLLFSRLLSALGSASGLVISMILIKDVHNEAMARKTFTTIVLCFAVVPFLATMLGSVLTHYIGWQAINYFLCLYAVVLYVLVQQLPAHLNNKKDQFALRSLVKSYCQLLQQKAYRNLVLIFSLGPIISYVFNSIAPLIVINAMHVSPLIYGWLSVIPSIGIVLGGFLSNYLAARYTAINIIRIGIILSLLSSILLLLTLRINLHAPIMLYLPAIFIFASTALIIPNASMSALSKVTDHANGASLLNATGLLISSLFVAASGKLIGLNVMALPAIFIGVSVLGLCLLAKENA